jgi:hypothetical protein
VKILHFYTYEPDDQATDATLGDILVFPAVPKRRWLAKLTTALRERELRLEREPDWPSAWRVARRVLA